jgi:hypothetical protein
MVIYVMKAYSVTPIQYIEIHNRESASQAHRAERHDGGVAKFEIIGGCFWKLFQGLLFIT